MKKHLVSWLKVTAIIAIPVLAALLGTFIGSEMTFTNFRATTEANCTLRVLALVKHDTQLQDFAAGCMSMGGHPAWYITLDAMQAGPTCMGTTKENE